MKKIISFLIIAIIIASCSKEKQILQNTVWQVESIKVHADSALTYPSVWEGWWGNNKPITLTFPKQNKYLLQLEANGHGNNVSITGNKINFKGGVSTLMCCDSPFAESCASLLVNKINHFTIKDSKLVLTGAHGEIINLVEQ
jgi:heat shock protein HslJ